MAKRIPKKKTTKVESLAKVTAKVSKKAKKVTTKKAPPKKAVAKKKPATKKPVSKLAKATKSTFKALNKAIAAKKKKKVVTKKKRAPIEFIRLAENAKSEKFVEMGKRVQAGEIVWAYYGVDGSIGYHHYKKK